MTYRVINKNLESSYYVKIENNIHMKDHSIYQHIDFSKVCSSNIRRTLNIQMIQTNPMIEYLASYLKLLFVIITNNNAANTHTFIFT